MNKRIVASEIRDLASRIAASPFNMTEIELELYRNYKKLHDTLQAVKGELVKYSDEENEERDPVKLQMILDDYDEDIRKIPRSTDGLHSYMVQSDALISDIYDAVQKNDFPTLTELKAELDLLAGKIFAEHQKLRQR